MKRLNVIIVAHEFSPNQGSECAVGWNLVNEISKYHNVTVIYATSNQFGTSNYQNHVFDFFSKNKQSEYLTLVSIPQSNRVRWLIKINKLVSPSNKSIGLPMLYFFCYKYWQKDVYKFIKRENLYLKADIIHQLTSISFREPGYLWKLDTPFFWGPISGNVSIPSGFFNLLNWKQAVFQVIRSVILFLQLKYSFRVHSALKKATMVYCVTKNDFIFFNAIKGINVSSLLDVGCSSYQTNFQSRITKKKLIFLWVGRIFYSKALEIFLRSISIVNNSSFDKEVSFIIIGDGPDLKKNYFLAEKLNLTNISWLGQLPHNKVFEFIKKSDCLIHTSVREATSATILESLSFGVPVVCHDAFGMSIAVNESCGIKIPFICTEKSVIGFAEAMIYLIKNPEKIDELSLGAFQRSKELSWENMGIKISDDYLNTHAYFKHDP